MVRDPAGWERRTLWPALAGVQFELVRLTLEPGANAGPSQPHAPETVAVVCDQLPGKSRGKDGSPGWRFRKERSDPVAAEHLERRAQTWVIVAMFVVALYVGFEAVRALVEGSHPESSAFGFGIGAISLLVLPMLGVMKLRVAGHLGSPALRGDGVLTLAAAALAAITLVALLANSLLGWSWADPAAALVIAMALAAEAMRVAVRHRFG